MRRLRLPEPDLFIWDPVPRPLPGYACGYPRDWRECLEITQEREGFDLEDLTKSVKVTRYTKDPACPRCGEARYRCSRGCLRCRACDRANCRAYYRRTRKA